MLQIPYKRIQRIKVNALAAICPKRSFKIQDVTPIFDSSFGTCYMSFHLYFSTILFAA